MSTTDEQKPDGAIAAFIEATFGTAAKMGKAWQAARAQVGDEPEAERPPIVEAYLLYNGLRNNAVEAAIRAAYPRAVLEWNVLEERARFHGIWFHTSAQAHHRAAILDHLDDPSAPSLLTDVHMSRYEPIIRSRENWKRHDDLRKPFEIAENNHDASVRAQLAALTYLPAMDAARAVAAIKPRAMPRASARPRTPAFA